MDDNTSSPFHLSPIDCLLPRRLTTVVLFFPRSHVEPNTIVESLKKGLELTLQHLPMLSGTVKLSDTGPQSGRLVVSEPHHTVDEMIVVNDLRAHRDYDYDRIRKKHFPTYDWESAKPEFYAVSPTQKFDLPVFKAKVTLIKGGLVFAISVHHCFTDGNGTATVMETWCSYCKGEKPTLAADSISRSRLTGERGLADIKEFPEMNYINDSGTDMSRFGQLLKFLQQKSEYWFGAFRNLAIRAWYRPVQKEGSLSAISVTRVLFFSNDKLKELKMLASDGKQQDNEGSWISTQDALTALLWCSFVHARQECSTIFCNGSSTKSKDAVKRPSAQSEDPMDQIVQMIVVLNARQLFQPQLPTSFIGNALLLTGVRCPLSNVTMTAGAISVIAYSLRASIKGRTPSYLSRYLSALASVEDIRKISPAPGPDPNYTLRLSSWRGQDYYNQGWRQIFGAECERVRYNIGPIEKGLAVILPELKGAACLSSAAGLEVVIGVSEGDIIHLEGNKLLNYFCEWR